MTHHIFKILLASCISAGLVQSVAAAPETSLRPVAKPTELIAQSTPQPFKRPENLQDLVQGEGASPEGAEDESASSEVMDAPDDGADTDAQDLRELRQAAEAAMGRIEESVPMMSPDEDTAREDTPSTEPDEPEVVDAVEETPTYPAPFGFDGLTLAEFTPRKDELLRQFEEARGSGESLVDAKLDLAKFFVGNAFLPEAKSILNTVDVEGLSEQNRQDYHALRMAHHVLSDAGGPVPSPDVLETASPSTWEDHALWQSLNASRTGNYREAKSYLEDAYAVFQDYPVLFQRETMAPLLETAIRTGEWTLAKEMATAMGNDPQMSDSPAYSFLLGFAAERSDRLTEAFDAYREASLGSDIYAQRARMALVDMGLNNDAMSLEDAETFLEDNRFAWRGDRYEVEALKRLASVYARQQKNIETLETLSDIFTRFPDHEAAGPASQKAERLLNRFYSAGANGDIPLNEFLQNHDRLEHRYRFVEPFHEENMKLAARLEELGASAKAAEEYRTIAEYLEVAEDLGIWDLSPYAITEARLGQARTQAQGWQYENAADTLVNLEERELGPYAPDFNRLKATVFDRLETPEDVIETSLDDPDAEYIRMRAQAYWSGTDWQNATNAYLELWEDFPDAFNRADAMNLLLASYRARDMDTARRIANEFPDITESNEWSQVAKGLLDAAPNISPLREASAEQRVEDTENALDTFDSLNVD